MTGMSRNILHHGGAVMCGNFTAHWCCTQVGRSVVLLFHLGIVWWVQRAVNGSNYLCFLCAYLLHGVNSGVSLFVWRHGVAREKMMTTFQDRKYQVIDTYNGGEPGGVIRFTSEAMGVDGHNECFVWIHKHTSFSVSEALENQGYKFEAQPDQDIEFLTREEREKVSKRRRVLTVAKRRAAKLKRPRLQELLENQCGMAVYDDEPIADLRAALVECVGDCVTLADLRL